MADLSFWIILGKANSLRKLLCPMLCTDITTWVPVYMNGKKTPIFLKAELDSAWGFENMMVDFQSTATYYEDPTQHPHKTRQHIGHIHALGI
jgi:hypothetical protein